MSIQPVDVLYVKNESEEGMIGIKMCPYRIAVQTHKAIMVGTDDVTVQDFLPCIREKCAAYYNRGDYHHSCLRLNEVLQKGI